MLAQLQRRTQEAGGNGENEPKEALLKATLERAARERTLFSVSHSVEAMKVPDRVVVRMCRGEAGRFSGAGGGQGCVVAFLGRTGGQRVAGLYFIL